MLRENLSDLVAFVAVAREGSFTRASARLGVSQSALSHTVRGMEKRLGVRLLSRTTRKVSPTTEGRQVLERIAPHLEQVEEELAALVAARDRPAGSFRITAIDFATNWLIWPKLREVLRDYPDLKIEIYNDYGLTDIVSEEFDAGVRSGEQVASGMIGVRIGPDFRLVPVAAPAYLEGRSRPEVPDDLTGHLCINLRLPTRGGLLAWWFERDGHETRVRVDGQLTFNQTYQMIEAALDGFGIAYVPDVLVAGHVAEERLEILLDDWCPPMPGYFLYYPHRRQESRAFSILVEALRHRD